MRGTVETWSKSAYDYEYSEQVHAKGDTGVDNKGQLQTRQRYKFKSTGFCIRVIG